MRLLIMSILEVEVADDACPGCAAKAVAEGMTEVFEDGELTIVDEENCRNPGLETEVHPLSLTVTGVGFPLQIGETRH